MLQDRTGQGYEEMRGLLLQVAAYIGEGLCRQMGGEWALDMGHSLCFVAFSDPETAYEEGLYSPVLQDVVKAWRSPEMGHDLIGIFKRARRMERER
jgi:hypothetical protein